VRTGSEKNSDATEVTKLSAKVHRRECNDTKPTDFTSLILPLANFRWAEAEHIYFTNGS